MNLQKKVNIFFIITLLCFSYSFSQDQECGDPDACNYNSDAIEICENNDITFSLKSMTNFNRYGSVETNSSGRVLLLKEKEELVKK